MNSNLLKNKNLFMIITTLLFTLCLSVVAFAEESDKYITNTRVNFRSAASTESEVYETLNTNIEVTVKTHNENGWSKVVYKDKEGYINSEFLSTKPVYAVKEGGSELLDWSEVKNIFTTYTPAEVYDVRTGITYYVQSFSNGKHADVETLTKDDTAKLLQTYGGRWQWDPRPVWVTINGRTIAGSINGMPHGGGTIAGNGLNGQVCIHFLGSTTHNGNQSFARDHQNGVMEAYNAN